MMAGVEPRNVNARVIASIAGESKWCNQRLTEWSNSFPSGHTMVATAVYGMTAIVIARLRPGLRVPVYGSAPFLVLFIGISRVFLGVHWPTDVLAGFAAGGLVLVAGTLAIGCVYAPRMPARVR